MAKGDHIVCPPGRRDEEGRPREAQGIDNPLLQPMPLRTSCMALSRMTKNTASTREHDNAEQGTTAGKVKPFFRSIDT